MSRNNTSGNQPVPTNLKETLIQLESTLNEWENISPDEPSDIETRLEKDKEILEKELQKKARVILDQLKTQIEELSE